MRRGVAVLLLATLLAGALAACASGPGGRGDGPGRGRGGGRGDRGAAMRPYAQPSDVIAAELGMGRAARDEGQWTALAERAADGARIDWNGSAGDAAGWLSGRANPAAADRWSAREAWASCDGSVVVATGIGSDAAGQWSRFTRVWERERRGGDYRWSYTLWQPDAELTRTRQEEARERAATAAEDADAILVESLNFVRARVAECPQRPAGQRRAPDDRDAPPATPGMARDGTLRWSATPGTLSAWWLVGGEWQQIHPQPTDGPTGAS